jgi:general secretion pathway protein A
MYESFYGFKEKPFTLTPDPRYFYPSRAHREALDHLLYGIREREGFIVVTGDVGTGKTTLCRAILLQLEEGTTTAVILNPILSEDELLRAILRDFGLPAVGRTKNELIGELNDFLLQTIVDGRRAVLIVDEAQNLSHELLEQIRLLSNLETERDKLIQIILVGQLQLLAHLQSPEMKQLNQRVSVRYRLRPLSYQETCQYIYHRLMVAGGTTGVSFSTGAMKAIHTFSEGIPRLINLAADRALLQGYTDQAREITTKRAKAALASLSDDAPERPLAGAFGRLFVPKAAVVVAVVALLAAAGAWFLLNGRQVPGWLPIDRVAASAAAPVVPGVDAAYSVLVGSFSTETEARDVERRLAGRGYPTVVARAATQAGRDRFSVLLGGFAEMADAERVRDDLVNRDGFAAARIVRAVNAAEATP